MERPRLRLVLLIFNSLSLRDPRRRGAAIPQRACKPLVASLYCRRNPSSGTVRSLRPINRTRDDKKEGVFFPRKNVTGRCAGFNLALRRGFHLSTFAPCSAPKASFGLGGLMSFVLRFFRGKTPCHCETRVGGVRQSLSGLVSPLWRLCIAGGTLVQAL